MVGHWHTSDQNVTSNDTVNLTKNHVVEDEEKGWVGREGKGRKGVIKIHVRACIHKPCGTIRQQKMRTLMLVNGP